MRFYLLCLLFTLCSCKKENDVYANYLSVAAQFCDTDPNRLTWLTTTYAKSSNPNVIKQINAGIWLPDSSKLFAYYYDKDLCPSCVNSALYSCNSHGWSLYTDASDPNFKFVKIIWKR